jgi:hypothetical protein
VLRVISNETGLRTIRAYRRLCIFISFSVFGCSLAFNSIQIKGNSMDFVFLAVDKSRLFGLFETEKYLVFGWQLVRSRLRSDLETAQ